MRLVELKRAELAVDVIPECRLSQWYDGRISITPPNNDAKSGLGKKFEHDFTISAELMRAKDGAIAPMQHTEVLQSRTILVHRSNFLFTEVHETL